MNGHRNGKGRQIFYTEDENMDEDDYVEFEYIFEGEFLNAKGKEYYFKFGNLQSEGEYRMGERNGRGKEYYYNRVIYDGLYINGIRVK